MSMYKGGGVKSTHSCHLATSMIVGVYQLQKVIPNNPHMHMVHNKNMPYKREMNKTLVVELPPNCVESKIICVS